MCWLWLHIYEGKLERETQVSPVVCAKVLNSMVTVLHNFFRCLQISKTIEVCNQCVLLDYELSRFTILHSRLLGCSGSISLINTPRKLFFDPSIGFDETNTFQLKLFILHENCGRHRLGRFVGVKVAVANFF